MSEGSDILEKHFTKPRGGQFVVIICTFEVQYRLIFRLADYKKGGELINVYNNGGQDEAELFIVEKLPGLMYNNGKGQVINRNDYLRWKFQNKKHVSSII